MVNQNNSTANSSVWRRISGTVLLLGLSACIKQPPGPAIVIDKSIAAVHNYATAKTGWLLAEQIALAQADDARLVKVTGQWIDAGGSSSNWSYQFISTSRQLNIVIADGNLQLLNTLQAPFPPIIDTTAWAHDSDDALSQLALIRQLSYPLSSMVLTGDLIWRISGPASDDNLNAAN